jgi:hypothetical protein
MEMDSISISIFLTTAPSSLLSSLSSSYMESLIAIAYSNSNSNGKKVIIRRTLASDNTINDDFLFLNVKVLSSLSLKLSLSLSLLPSSPTRISIVLLVSMLII